MNIKHFTLTVFGFLIFSSSFAQNGFEFKLQLMQDELTWGVYVNVLGDEPSGSTISASGQVTVVMPADFEWSDKENHNGFWDANAIVVSPIEDVERKYVSFGLVQAEPLYPIPYSQLDDILLFTFKGGSCPDSIYLIDCNTPDVNDPFCPDFDDDTPFLNSAFSNPGNDLAVLDLAPGGGQYLFLDLFAPSAWNCHDCDGDGIPNAHEDTNGNGVYDPGIDVSDYCDGGIDPCEDILPLSANLSGGGAVCAGGEAELFVEINGGQGPFDVVIFDGTQNIFVDGYESGSPIPVSPAGPAQYTLVRIDAGPFCELTTGLSGFALVTIEQGFAIEPLGQTEVYYDCSVPSEATAIISNPGGLDIAYLWQKSCDGGLTWEIEGTPAESSEAEIEAELSILASAQNDGCQFRLIASTLSCGENISETLTYFYDDEFEFEFSQNPEDVSVCADAEEIALTATLNILTPDVEAIGQWEKSCDDGATWEVTPDAPVEIGAGANTSQLTITDVDESLDGCQYRLSFAHCSQTYYSSEATLRVATLPSIIEQPLPQETCAGEAVVFNVELDAPGDVFWRKSCDGGATWQLIFPGAPGYEGSLTPALTVLATEATEDGCLFQALIDDVSTGNLCGTTFTEPAALTVQSPPEFAQHPATQTLCMGSSAIFETSLVGTTDGVTYQWQQSCDDGASWSDIEAADAAYSGALTRALSVEANTGNANCQYRLVATSADCGSTISQAALLNAKAPVEFSAMPTDKSVCPAEIIQFAAQADAFGQIDYQWQMSTDGVDFQDINFSDIGGFAGYNSNELTVNNAEAVDGYAFRLVGNTAICPDRVYSEAASVEVKETISISASPEDVTICQDEYAIFTTGIDLPDQTGFQLQWQQLLNGASDWSDLTDGSFTIGANTEELWIGVDEEMDGSLYRLQATGECGTVYSDPALLLAQDCSIDSNFIEMKIGLLPGGEGWGVYIRLAEGFEPHDYQTTIAGRVVIATDAGFGFHSLISEAAGTWTPGTIVLENWQHPNTRYFTFDLEANNNQLLLKPGNEIMLFRFKPMGDCPKQMYIVEHEDELVAGLEPTEFSGVDLDENYFFLSRIYEYDAWNCHGNQALMVDDENTTAAVSTSDEMELGVSQNTEKEKVIGLDFASQNNVEGMVLFPNPATDFVNIQIGTESENARLHLLNLQGQTIETIEVQARTDLRLETVGLPNGLYFIALEVGGEIVQREKLVKK